MDQLVCDGDNGAGRTKRLEPPRLPNFESEISVKIEDSLCPYLDIAIQTSGQSIKARREYG